MGDLFMRSDALLSPCGRYRHWLSREWDADLPVCGFVMLNPSTADADLDDPTIRRCIGFAKREGCGGLIVANVYQLRATDPAEIKRADDPVGPDADSHILQAARRATGPMIAAWGTHAGERGKHVAQLLSGHLLCLGTTKSGAPRHPLYLAADTPLVAFVEAGGAT